MMTTTQAILFDLDGTLLDTAEDLGQALNDILTGLALPILPLTKIRPAAGRGCKGLLKLGLNVEEHDPRYPELCEQLLNFYEENLLNTTQLFSGMEEVLNYLEARDIPWGIVTNKPEKYTTKILKGLQLTERAHCVISGDSLPKRKPHPEPILHACKLLQIAPQHCLYVGDSEVDIIASKAAGMPVVAALYGYIPLEENPQLWNADGYVHRPVEIINSFNGILGLPCL